MKCPECNEPMEPTVYEHDGKEYVIRYTCHNCHIAIKTESER